MNRWSGFGVAVGVLAGDAAEDACEQKGLTKFGKTKITGCDSCTNLGTLGSFVETTTDGANALVYCASPSAAFLDVRPAARSRSFVTAAGNGARRRATASMDMRGLRVRPISSQARELLGASCEHPVRLLRRPTDASTRRTYAIVTPSSNGAAHAHPFVNVIVRFGTR
jgi:hypothetical protein